MSSNLKLLKICEFCSNDFYAGKTTTRFCSNRCSSLNYKEKVRVKKHQFAKKEFKFKKLESSEEVVAINLKPYLNIKETCLLLNASDSTIRKLIKDKILPTMRIGKKHLIRRSDIEMQFKTT